MSQIRLILGGKLPPSPKGLSCPDVSLGSINKVPNERRGGTTGLDLLLVPKQTLPR